ncbi:MAG: hypothetical protein ACQESH_08830 [Campylobacterota bacterium]
MNFMKTLIATLFLLVTSLSASNHGADNSDVDVQKVEQEAQEFGKTLQNYTLEKKDQTLKQMQQYLQKADTRIQNYEQKMEKNYDTMSSKAKKQYKETIKQLRKERNQLSQAYGEMKQSSKAAYKDVKKAAIESYDRFEKGLQKAWKDLQ